MMRPSRRGAAAPLVRRLLNEADGFHTVRPVQCRGRWRLGDLDSLFRGAAIGIALLLGLAYWRTRPGSGLAWTGSLYAAGIIAYLLLGHPGFAAWRPLLRLVVGILALAAPFFFWAQARLIFDDGFRLQPRHFLWLAAIEGAGLLRFVLPGDAVTPLAAALDLGFRLASLALVAQALWLVWRGRAADLVEARARLRLVFVLIAGIAT